MKWQTALALLLSLTTARAVILFRTDAADANTSAPDLAFPHDGWDFEGTYGFFLGTPIAPHFFVTAKHVSGGVGSVLTFQGVNYSAIRDYRDPTSDLDILEVSGTFPYFAALYAKQDEPGKRIVDIGRGTERGDPIDYNNDLTQLRGWSHGAGLHTQRWGENIVAGAFTYQPDWDLLQADFDKNGLPNECHLSSGDSGGAAFIDDGGVWKLAGINYAIDDGFYMQPDATTVFNGALFDLRGFYVRSGGGFMQIDLNGPPVPTSFYPTRISTKLSWIYRVIDPTGDYDGDGRPNLLQYAEQINEPLTGAWSSPTVAIGSGYVSLTYRKISGTSLQYQIDQSSDLVSWTAAAPNEIVRGTNEDVQTIEAQVPTGSSALFLRLRITQ